MHTSVFEIFTVVIGPSSSHTVGPMRAARTFVDEVLRHAGNRKVARVQVDLYGSLAATGVGHGTPGALLAGLEGETPETTDPDEIPRRQERVAASGTIDLAGGHPTAFDRGDGIGWHKDACLPKHSNGMLFRAWLAGEDEPFKRIYYSIGGGFITGADLEKIGGNSDDGRPLPYPYTSAAGLMDLASRSGLGVAGVIRRNEEARRSPAEVVRGLDHIWDVMRESAHRGLRNSGRLPGALHLRRRAPELFESRIEGVEGIADELTLQALDWINLHALAVSEENAAAGRIVTAPTAGSAGIVPAVLHYYCEFVPTQNTEGVRTFLLAAGGIGALFKERASISGAEVGCQGETGVAASMAAAGLVAAFGGDEAMVENAAEIAMEHSLGLTCDPVGGLVQVPCIERNAMGAVKAINAARLAIWQTGDRKVALDRVIEAMRQTGADMAARYKETSGAGLAVNVPFC